MFLSKLESFGRKIHPRIEVRNGGRMRQVLLCVSILLLGLTWSFAQTSGSSETSPSGSGANQSAGAHSGASGQMGQSTASGHTTVEGCLNGSNGSYTLTDKNGNTYQLTGDTAKLSEHVGHEVKITGTSSGAGSSASGGTTGAMGGSGSQQSLQVTSVKHISKSCQAGGAMSH
jgi:hypothetical protein